MMSDQSVPPPAASGRRCRSVAASAVEGPFPCRAGLRVRRPRRGNRAFSGRRTLWNRDRQFRVVGRHAARIVADHPFDLRLERGLRSREFHPLGETGLSGESSDLHAEQFVEIAVRRVELFDAAFERDVLVRREGDRRGVGTSVVGAHVVHVVACGNRGFEHDAVGVVVETFRRARPRDVLARGRCGGEQCREERQKYAHWSLHGRIRFIIRTNIAVFCGLIATFAG